MNKKVLKVAFVAVIAMVSGLNVFNAQKSEVLSDIALANVEALAGCESPVLTKKGRETYLECTNDNGEYYDLLGCDFDEGYSTICEGRSTR